MSELEYLVTDEDAKLIADMVARRATMSRGDLAHNIGCLMLRDGYRRGASASHNGAIDAEVSKGLRAENDALRASLNHANVRLESAMEAMKRVGDLHDDRDENGYSTHPLVRELEGQIDKREKATASALEQARVLGEENAKLMKDHADLLNDGIKRGRAQVVGWLTPVAELLTERGALNVAALVRELQSSIVRAVLDVSIPFATALIRCTDMPSDDVE
jgi:hypothetical protein